MLQLVPMLDVQRNMLSFVYSGLLQLVTLLDVQT